MKRKRVLLKILLIVIVVFILGIAIQKFVPRKVISDTENISISRVLYHGSKISVDEAELINILDRYNAKRTLKGFFPYDPGNIDIEIDIMDKHKPKHILLGEFNIWYESADKEAYKILNAQQLKDELNSILNRNIF